jgi:hypothetical protein
MEAKETYYGGKRDLLWMQKRPTMEAKDCFAVGAKRYAVRCEREEFY